MGRPLANQLNQIFDEALQTTAPRYMGRGLARTVEWFSTLGRDIQHDDSGRRVRLTNLLCWAGIAISVFYSVGCLLHDAQQMQPIIICNLVFLCGMVLSLIINRLGRYGIARAIVVLFGISLFIAVAYYMGRDAGSQLYLYCTWVASLLIFPRNEKWVLISVSLLHLGLYYLITQWFTESQLIPPPDEHFLLITHMLGVIGSFGFISLTILIFISQLRRAESRAAAEHARSEKLLDNILPQTIAKELKQGPRTIAHRYDNTSFLFADLVGFSEMATSMQPAQLVDMLNHVFSDFDALVDEYDLEKIKTIGDAYMLAAGIPLQRGDHANAVARIALDMRDGMHSLRAQTELDLQIRIGINSGPVIAGVIGSKRFAFDAWGETVNVASRMESQGLIGRIQVSDATAALLQDDFDLQERGLVDIKGQGAMRTWFLEGQR